MGSLSDVSVHVALTIAYYILPEVAMNRLPGWPPVATGEAGMAEIIQAIYCDPPIVVARLGGSPTPVVAYSWEESPNPRNDGDTVIAPEWSFEILPDSSVSPFKPDSVRFRDGPLIRPVARSSRSGRAWA